MLAKLLTTDAVKHSKYGRCRKLALDFERQVANITCKYCATAEKVVLVISSGTTLSERAA
jgi:hypothetical protein